MSQYRPMHASRSAILLPLLLALQACAAGPAVLGSDELPVRRVVMYRNGVAYFERSGQFEGERVDFAVRRSAVGDFLASLTTIERTPGGIQSVSFDAPPEEETEEPPEPMPAAERGPSGPGKPKDPRVDVQLRFAGDDEHDVTVSYVVAAPIWRPTYRIVLGEEKALLQAWAVVQNLSGEDWKGVQLSLTTGAPIAFESDLGTPITPKRPLVTDTGEVVRVVPTSETTVVQDEAAGNAPMAEPMPAPEAMEEEAAMARPAAPARARRSRKRQQVAPQGLSADEVHQSVQSMAAVAVLGEGVTRYDLDRSVSVPDGGSSMVAILSRRVEGEEVRLYGHGVHSAGTHPFRAARVVNQTGATLEKGPVSVLGADGFYGQGVLEPLPPGATSFVPFAVDRAVVVDTDHASSQQEGRLVRIANGRVVVETFSQRTTRYTVRNGNGHRIKLVVKHPRWRRAELFEPPSDIELSESGALVPLSVPARGKAKVAVRERTPVTRTVDFMSDMAAEAVALYLAGPAAEQEHSATLRRALDIRTEIVEARKKLQATRRKREQLARQAEETRENLKALRKVEKASDLRQRLVRRMAELDSKLGELTKSTVELEETISELKIRLSEALSEVTLKAPPEA